MEEVSLPPSLPMNVLFAGIYLARLASWECSEKHLALGKLGGGKEECHTVTGKRPSKIAFGLRPPAPASMQSRACKQLCMFWERQELRIRAPNPRA